MIRALLWMVGILFVILIVQTTLLNAIALWGTKPDILLLLFIILTIQNGSIPSLICGFAIGIILDVLAGTPVGYHSFVLTLFGYLFGLGKGKVFFDPIVVPLIMSIIATFFYTVSLFIVSGLFNLAHPFATFFNTSFMIQLLYNLVAAPIIYLIYNFLKQKFQNPRRGFDG